MGTRHSNLRRILIAQAVVGVVLLAGVGAASYLRASGIQPRFLMEPPAAPRYTWKSIDKRHWQASTATPGEETSVTDAREGNTAGCAPGMVRVAGNYRLETHGVDGFGELERIQDGACTDWISKDFPARCRTFDRDKIKEGIAKLPTRALDFCIDRFEYPNVRGENPMIVVTFHEAEALCKKGKKRLCNESEWTFSCEGDDVEPYPYGYGRDTTACVVDRNWRPFKEGALGIRDGQVAREELDRLWQAEPSGSRGSCKSVFGVYDLTGNVDEWTRTTRSTGYASVLKGGYWGPVRARCRPSTRAHNEDFVAYQQSFRCCSDSDRTIAAPSPMKVPSVPVPAPTAVSGDTKVATTDLTSAGWDSNEERDELDALKKARVGMACAFAPGAGPSLAGAGLLAVAGLLVSRRRRS